MSILLTVIGATIGAVIGSLFIHWRNDVAKERQQLESKTPYDYALTNAINERDRLQDELRTIHALKRTVEDTERIRNEMDTILSYGGEEESEGVYDTDKVHRELEDVTKRWESNMKELTGGWDIPDVSKATDDERLSEDDVEHLLIKDIINKASKNLELAVEFAKMTVQDDEAIRKQLEETSKELAEETKELRRGIQEFREEGK